MTRNLTVFATVQEIKSGRVYILFSDGPHFCWTRATRDYPLFGPFDYLSDLFEHMARQEGHTAHHWLNVFAQFRPEVNNYYGPAMDASNARFIKA